MGIPEKKNETKKKGDNQKEEETDENTSEILHEIKNSESSTPNVSAIRAFTKTLSPYDGSKIESPSEIVKETESSTTDLIMKSISSATDPIFDDVSLTTSLSSVFRDYMESSILRSPEHRDSHTELDSNATNLQDDYIELEVNKDAAMVYFSYPFFF